MGLPYGMLRHAGWTSPIGKMIDQIDASVAPPRLTTSIAAQRARMRGGSSSGIQSPLSIARRSDETASSPVPTPGLSTSIWSSAGTVFQIVTRVARDQPRPVGRLDARSTRRG